MGSSNAGMMSIQNGVDAQHQHQLPHMVVNKPMMNNMSGGAISAIPQNNMNMANSGLNKSPHNNKLNSPPGGMMGSIGNGPPIHMHQTQQGMNNMLNPQMGVTMGPMSNSGAGQMKTAVMMSGGAMGQVLHNGPMGGVQPRLQTTVMQQQPQQQPNQRLPHMQPMMQGPRLQVC